MVLRGKVKNGKVLLNDPKALPDGTEVEVRPVKKRPRQARPAKAAKGRPKQRSLAERLANVIGKAKGLPPDASVNVDHYLMSPSRRKWRRPTSSTPPLA